MQYHKIPLIAAVVFMASLSCTNNTQQRAVEHPNELSEETHLSPTDLENSFEWPEGIKMGLSLSFDDARPSQIDKGIPLFDKYKDRKSTRLNSSHVRISYAVFCLKKKKK